jgi:hypothetical protein
MKRFLMAAALLGLLCVSTAEAGRTRIRVNSVGGGGRADVRVFANGGGHCNRNNGAVVQVFAR